MAIRVVVVPQVGSGISGDVIRAAYFLELQIAGARWFKFDDWFWVIANLSSTDVTSISAHADATILPANLDAQIGANLATVQATVEGWNIPSEWITSTHTYRDVARIILKWAAVLTRFFRFYGKFLDAGFTLNNVIGDLSAAKRQQLQGICTDLGIDTSSITLSTTIRAAVRIIANQMPAITLLGESF
jgi:hypothetical protein